MTDLKLFNESVSIDGDSVLQKPIWDTDNLTLSYDQYIVSFEFAALSFVSSDKNRFRYKLEGFESEWNEVDRKRRFATYTSLPAGDYAFRVQGTNNDGVWSDKEVALNITVTPPWWETTWFRGAVLALAVGLVFGGFRWRVRSIEQRSRELEKQVTERTKELNE